MNIQDYINSLPARRKLSEVKRKILERLWGDEAESFPKPWVSSKELLELTGQKYFDRRTRELRDQLGCDLESSYQEEFSGHAWRINSPNLSPPQDRDYLTQSQKLNMFEKYKYHCATCGTQSEAGVRGLQADHKVPLSRGGGNELENWQPMCNNCNVGKRRACDGCELNCNVCSWAFPELVGVQTMVSIDESILRRIEDYSAASGQSKNQIMEESAKYFLDDKEN